MCTFNRVYHRTRVPNKFTYVDPKLKFTVVFMVLARRGFFCRVTDTGETKLIDVFRMSLRVMSDRTDPSLLR